MVGTGAGAWDTLGAADGVWEAMSVSQNWEVADTDTGGRAGALFQVRRLNDTGGGDEGTVSSGYLTARIEFEP